ncbi:hypothetical protein KC799_21325, partial [candidate division KSB1 bacterium]|nr:hypothetical protein [candidate division KSB1 bacterium]
MSIRLSLYDFFAYTIPGTFYILVALFGLVIFDIIDPDPTFLTDLSLFAFIILLGAGYILGLLIDAFAYRWLWFWQGNNEIARKSAFDFFHKQYPWIELHITPEEWPILLQAMRIKALDAVKDIEQHNAVSIMLRNISLGLFITSLIFLLAFIILYAHIGNIILATIALFLSIISLKRSSNRRQWFYSGVLHVFITEHLLQDKRLDERIQLKPHKTEESVQVESADFAQESK